MKTENLKCRLTPEEVAARAAELAGKLRERDLIEYERKSAAEDFKGAIKTIEIKIGELAEQVREKAEYRQVRVYDQRNDATKQLEERREDTGEVVRMRALLPGELQVELFGVERDEAAEA